MNKVGLIFIFVLIIFPCFVTAATISGNIYDFSFKLVENTIVEINTEPRQMMVATDGRYNFNVPPGSYVLSASNGDLIAEDKIEIVQEGNFRFDIILLPNFNQDEWVTDAIDELDNDSGLNEFDIEFSRNGNLYLFYFLFGALAILVNFVIIFRKKILLRLSRLSQSSLIHKVKTQPAENLLKDDDITDVIDFIKSENGRTTQKEIRKNIPLSESKISLLLSELENDGRIKRFKRGRSNIVILRK